MSPHHIDLTLVVGSANGTATEFFQANAECVHVTLRLLAAPQLFAQRHLLLASQHCASLIPCPAIDLILVRTSAPAPLKFPVNHPAGQFDLSVFIAFARLANPPISLAGRRLRPDQHRQHHPSKFLAQTRCPPRSCTASGVAALDSASAPGPGQLAQAIPP